MPNGQKLTNLSQKNIPPQKGPFFGGEGGGGSATRWLLRTKCLGLGWVSQNIKKANHLSQLFQKT